MPVLSEAETIGLAFTMLDYFHTIDELAGRPKNRRFRNSMVNEWQAKAWGGIFGDTPRATDDERYFEAIAPVWAQAIANHPDLAAPSARA